ncbi:MAG: ABC transporter ATP-binding protein [Verrucomicrobiota bacterium]
MIPLLEARRIGKRFSGTVVLDDLSLAIAPGEAVGLFGPNGSGKTTLVDVLSGSTLPEDGTVWFEGRDVTRLRMDARYRIGIARTFQIPHPYPALTVLDAVRVPRFAPGHARGVPGRPAPGDDAEAGELLSRAGLYDQRNVPCARLSQGCLRRLEFARALACRPKLLILDEVFSALSAADEDDLVALLRRTRAEDGTAYLLVSHNPPLLADTCDRILFLEDGRIVRERKA